MKGRRSGGGTCLKALSDMFKLEKKPWYLRLRAIKQQN
jgi:uncharacterized Fe-S cluster protein YjdI